MISSFWNFCPCVCNFPMPFAKLSSEYRSTFQWPEFRGPQQTNSSSVRAIVQQPIPIPYIYSEPQGIPRRKRAPGFAQQVQQSTTLDWIGHPEKEKVVKLQKDKDEITRAPTHVHIQVKDSKNKDNTSMRGAAGKPSVRVPSDILENNTISVLPPQGKIMNREKMDLKIAEGREERRNERISKSAHIDQVDKDHNKVEKRIDPTKGEYQTEYKKRYRPFSQYEYVEGKFTKKKSDRELGGPWYYEVIELRKKAEEYKFRGWGSELVPANQNGAHVHNHHLWEEVSKRKSLAALALIPATPRYVTKEEKEKENNRKSYAGKASPFIRPHTATPRHAMPDLDKSTKSPYEFETVHIKKKQPPFDTTAKPLLHANVSRAKARSLSAGPGHGGGRSPRKSTRQQSSSSSDHEAGGGWKPQAISSKGGEVAKLQQAKHPRPTTLATSPRPKTSSGQKGHDVRDSKLARHGQYFKSSADPSLGYHQDVVVKTPPEPTRVKSPEQLIAKSPDPVNWTVPLDKGFTVTQNVKDGERPQFHSSTATAGDSVKSSPAINSATSKNKNSSQVPTSMKKQSSTDKENKKSNAKQQELNGYEEKEKSKDKPKSSIFSRMKKSEDSTSSSTTSSSKKNSDKKADDKLTKPVPGTNLRCLEDPTFMFDPAPSTINNSSSENSKNLNLNPSPSKPVGVGVGDENSPGKPAYRVLEAPYGPDHDSPSSKGSSHSRSKASDVLEKARNKFDKFWGKDKSKDEEK